MIDLKTIKSLNIDKQLHKAKNRIRRIGIELEGGWMERPTIPLHADVSVFQDGLGSLPQRPNYVGEVTSDPLEPSKWKEWLKTHYPPIVDHTCGLHVHVSFARNMSYQRILDPTYPKTVVTYMIKWAREQNREGTIESEHPIWARLKGGNRYCLLQYNPEVQTRMTNKGHNNLPRRTVINYCHSIFGTAECRLLPMFRDVETATSAIQEFLSITNAYLLAKAMREKVVSISEPMRFNLE